MENFDLLKNDLQITATAQTFLREAARWGKFLSIIGFVFSGILAIAAFFAPSLYSNVSAFSELSESVKTSLNFIIIVFYLGFAILLFFPCFYLHKFSTKIDSALDHVHQENFEEAFKNLKSLFKFYGIVTVIILSIYVLVFIIAMLGAAMNR